MGRWNSFIALIVLLLSSPNAYGQGAGRESRAYRSDRPQRVNRYVEADDAAPSPPRKHNIKPSEATPLDVDPFAEDDSPRSIQRPDRGASHASAEMNDDEAPRTATRYPAREVRREDTRLDLGGSRARNISLPEEGEASLAPVRNEGPGKPGPTQLEGAQSPSLTLQKLVPTEIQVGRPATFALKVKNTGSVTAYDVTVEDVVPKGTEFVSATPTPRDDGRGHLRWELSAMAPGAESMIHIELMPVAEGEIGSVASVQFRADASARTVATRPQLAIKVITPPEVLVGDETTLKIQVNNPGTGTATNVMLVEKIPQGFRHEAGPELELEIGTLRPGETRSLELRLRAAAAGSVKNHLRVKADANLVVDDMTPLNAVAPELKVGLTGPKKRFLDRNATYTIAVSNPGSAAAKEIELVTSLPKGMKFVEANHHGHYDAASHAVYWNLEELPAQETGQVSLTAMPVAAGEQKILIRGKAQRGLLDEHNETVLVEGISAVQFELTDIIDPVEVNGETTYEIKVTNQGSKEATNVRIVATAPPEMRILSATGPAKFDIDGDRVSFAPLAHLAPKADTTYTIKVKGIAPGDLRFQVQLTSDETRRPITKEESTRVFADE
jgi:uncharacterized repeat protein (TIGR01451 family)